MALTTLDSRRTYVRLQADPVDLTGLNSSDVFEVLRYESGSFQFVFTGATDTATIEIQTSNDGGTSWDTLVNSSTVLSGSGSCTLAFFGNMPFERLRITVTEVSATGGASLDVYFVGKIEA